MRSLRPLGWKAAGLAVDLGTSRTQVLEPRSGRQLDEPTLVAYNRSGEPYTAGQAAWDAGERTGAALGLPVRRAQVVSPASCVRFLTLLFEQARLRVGGSVTVAIPATATPYESSVLVAVVASVTGAHVVPVDSLLAGAIGSGLPVDETAAGLVCDVGAGVFELGAVGDGRLLAHTGVRIGTRDYEDQPSRLAPVAQAALQRVLDSVPAAAAADLVARPLQVLGGGALLPRLVADLAAACRMEVTVPASPREAVVRGLSQCLAVSPEPVKLIA